MKWNVIKVITSSYYCYYYTIITSLKGKNSLWVKIRILKLKNNRIIIIIFIRKCDGIKSKTNENVKEGAFCKVSNISVYIYGVGKVDFFIEREN